MDASETILVHGHDTSKSSHYAVRLNTHYMSITSQYRKNRYGTKTEFQMITDNI